MRLSLLADRFVKEPQESSQAEELTMMISQGLHLDPQTVKLCFDPDVWRNERSGVYWLFSLTSDQSFPSVE